MSLTLATIRSTIYDFLREEEQDSSSYSPTFLNTVINATHYRICAGTVVDYSGMAIKKLKLPFLFKKRVVNNIGSTGLTADTTAGSTSISVSDTTDYPSSGYLWINDNIISYSGKTSTTFTGIPASGDYSLIGDWESGSRVYPVWALPTDYMNCLNVSYNNAVPMEFVDELEIFSQLYDRKMGFQYMNPYINGTNVNMTRYRAFYTIFNGAFFAPFYLDNSVGYFTMTYEKLPDTLTDDADVVTIPNDVLALDSIANIAVADVLFDRAEEQRGAQRLAKGITRLRELYSFYNRQSSEDQFGKPIRMQKGTGRNF